MAWRGSGVRIPSAPPRNRRSWALHAERVEGLAVGCGQNVGTGRRHAAILSGRRGTSGIAVGPDLGVAQQTRWGERGPRRTSAGLAHNPEVAGSNPAPATKEYQVRGQFPDLGDWPLDRLLVDC